MAAPTATLVLPCVDQSGPVAAVTAFICEREVRCDIEAAGPARAARLRPENRVLVNGNRTVVFG